MRKRRKVINKSTHIVRLLGKRLIEKIFDFNSYEDFKYLEKELDYCLRIIEIHAKINHIEIEAPTPRFIAFWWQIEDEWPDDEYNEYPKRSPFYESFKFDTMEEEHEFLINSIRRYCIDRIGIMRYIDNDEFEHVYHRIYQAWWALDHFQEKWHDCQKRCYPIKGTLRGARFFRG